MDASSTALQRNLRLVGITVVFARHRVPIAAGSGSPFGRVCERAGLHLGFVRDNLPAIQRDIEKYIREFYGVTVS
jgi:hypothetical protein